MARKASTTPKISAKTVKPANGNGPVASTEVRHSAVPKAQPSARPVITHEQIRARAYELFLAGAPGTELDHWLQAERELGGR